MALPRADIFPYLIVLKYPHEFSADPIQIIFEVTLQATTPRTLVVYADLVMEMFICGIRNIIYPPTKSLLLYLEG